MAGRARGEVYWDAVCPRFRMPRAYAASVPELPSLSESKPEVGLLSGGFGVVVVVVGGVVPVLTRRLTVLTGSQSHSPSSDSQHPAFDSINESSG
jgi:hypothetical protein